MVEVIPAATLNADGRLVSKLGGNLNGYLAAVCDVNLIGIARGDKLVILHVMGGVVEFQAVDDADLQHDEVTCLSFFHLPDVQKNQDTSSKRSHRPPDGAFVCGTRRGWLRWYATDGRLCMSQRLHDTPVLQIKPPPPSSFFSSPQSFFSFVILFQQNTVALMDTESVVQSLRATQTIRSGPLSGPNDGGGVSYRKYELEGQRVVCDVCVVFPENSGSNNGSNNGSKDSSSLSLWSPNKSAQSDCWAQLIAAGAFPMMGVYSCSDRHGTLRTAVALASELTSKLTSAVFSMARSWWSSGNESPVKSANAAPASSSDKIEDGKTLDMEWGLTDTNREFRVLSVAPNGKLAAVSDNFGRVLLIDFSLYVAVRMWKGYREAQVAWILDEGSLFLVMYAPRRGVLEVWRMRHGEREVILDVGLGCTLLPSLASRRPDSTCCFLMKPNGDLQRIHFSKELSKHLKSDQAALGEIRQLVTGGKSSETIQLMRKMYHPKMLVQAVLSLSQQDSSSLFLEAVTVALEQCSVKNSALPIMTPGVAQRVSTQDVTHLVWLDRYVRAYRVIELGENSEQQDGEEEDEPVSTSEVPIITCRQFLRCFTVHGTEEARLSAGISDDKRSHLARFLFSSRSPKRLGQALRWTRLASGDVEQLMADFFLSDVPVDVMERFVSSFLRRRKTLASDEATAVLPILLQRVNESENLSLDLRIIRCVLSNLADDKDWIQAEDRFVTLSKLPHLDDLPKPTVADALSGRYSLFKLLGKLEASDDTAQVAKILSDFPSHAALPSVREAHKCLELLNQWTELCERSRTEEVTVGDEEPEDEDANEDGDEELPTTPQATKLSAVIKALGSNGVVALKAWTFHIGPLFWKCVNLVEIATRTPSERTVIKMLHMNLAEFKHLCYAARDCLRLLTESWGTDVAPVDFKTLPFPSFPDATFNEAVRSWSERTKELGADFRHLHLLARSVCAVIRHHLRGVHVVCMLPSDSLLRDHLAKEARKERVAGSRFGTVEFQRREFVLKLCPVNNTLAMSFAKALDMDLAAVRRLASQVQYN